MKIAYTMNGIIGGLSGKNYEDTKQDFITELCKYVYRTLDKHILQNNDVDIFIFSWHSDKEDEIKEIYKPKKSLFMKQINFDVPTHLEGKNLPRVQAHYSRWYGFNEVMKLRQEYEKENNIKYDLVVNARFDLYWNHPINFSEFDINGIHFPYMLYSTWGWPHHAPELLDHIITASPKNMDVLISLYDKLDEYTAPDSGCRQWNSISHHFMIPHHLKQLGLLNLDTIKFSFKNCFDLDDIKASYSIIKYKKKTIEDILKELKSEK